MAKVIENGGGCDPFDVLDDDDSFCCVLQHRRRHTKEIYEHKQPLWQYDREGSSLLLMMGVGGKKDSFFLPTNKDQGLLLLFRVVFVVFYQLGNGNSRLFFPY